MYFSASCCLSSSATRWPCPRSRGRTSDRAPRPGEILQRLVEAVLRQRFRRGGIVADDVERRGRQCLHGEALRRVRRLVAERLANRLASFVATPRTWSLAGGPFLRPRDHVPGHRLGRLDRHLVAAALTRERTGQHDAQALLHRELPRGALVQLLRRPDAEGARDAVAIVGADEAGAFERELQHRLQRAVERRIAGGVLKSAISTDTGSCAAAGGGAARRPTT